MDGKTEINFEELVLLNNESMQAAEEVQFTVADFATGSDNEEEKEGEKAPVAEEVVITEAKKEEAAPEAKPTPDPILNTEAVSFSNVAKKLLENGEWKDFIVVEPDGTEVKFSDLENLDETTFLSAWEEQKKFSKEEQQKDFIPVKGVDENKLALINIIKDGGDLKEIFKDESQLKKPYEGVDLDVLQNQQNILYNQFLRQGLKESDAGDLVIKATKDLSIGTEVERIVKHYQNSYEENLKKVAQEVRESKIKEQENMKEYKKSLNTFYKEEGLEDGLSKTLSEAATKYSADGELYIDTVYQNLMKDPQKAKDLVFFMLEKEKFLQKAGATIKRDVEISNLRKVKLVQETSKSGNVIKEEEKAPDSPFGNIVLE